MQDVSAQLIPSQPSCPKLNPELESPVLKILLAEDNFTNQKLTLRQLRALGYQADVAVNGQAAIEAFVQTHYDLVLMDCQMPLVDGFDATLAIRTWEHQHSANRSNRAVVIAMTASDLAQDRERAIAVGMDDYLLKPVRRETLAALLETWSQIIATPSTFSASSHPAFNPYLKSNGTCPTIRCLHLDLTYLHHLSDNSSEFELELLQIFLKDSFAQLDRLKQAIADQDFQQIERISHYLKGASGNVGARVVQLAAAQLENQARQHQNQEMKELVVKLEFSFHQIQGINPVLSYPEPL